MAKLMTEIEVVVVVVIMVVVVEEVLDLQVAELVLLSLQNMRKTAGKAHLSLQLCQARVQSVAGLQAVLTAGLQSEGVTEQHTELVTELQSEHVTEMQTGFIVSELYSKMVRTQTEAQMPGQN